MVVNKKLIRRKLVKIPAIMNSRFLLALLKVVVHGNIGNSKLTSIGSLLKLVDIGAYSKDPEIFTLVSALEIAINCKMDGVEDNPLIMTLIASSLTQADASEIVFGLIEPIIVGSFELQEQEILYVLNVVTTYSKVGFLLNYKDGIIDKFLQLESGSSAGIQNIVGDFEKEITELHMKLHKTLSSDSLDINEPVSISDPEFMSKYFKTVYKLSKKKTRALVTGIKKYNEFLSEIGGFLTGKMYLINAPINSFKTGLLLYIAKWIQLYNSANYVERFKETGKRPTIFVVSLENTWDENIERLFSIFVKKNMSEVSSFENAETGWKESVYRTNSIIDICMYYGKANRFSPADLEYKIDELEARGCFVIATIVDYLRVMRDDLGNSDPRLKTISIATDLHELVARKPEMVLISAHHTNREGDKIITEVEDRGGVDKAKSLGRQHLVEANGVEDAIDFSMYIVPETSPYTGDHYLAFKKGKCRYKRTPVEYFAHELKNRFYLTDDLELDHYLSINSITETMHEAGAVGGEKKIFSDQVRSGDKGRTSTREPPKTTQKAFVSEVFE